MLCPLISHTEETVCRDYFNKMFFFNIFVLFNRNNHADIEFIEHSSEEHQQFAVVLIYISKSDWTKPSYHHSCQNKQDAKAMSIVNQVR